MKSFKYALPPTILCALLAGLVVGGCSSKKRSYNSSSTTGAATSDVLAINNVTPNSGPTTGGNEVTINGTEFEPGSQVYFDGTPAVDVRFASVNTILVKAPAHADAVVSVSVVTPAGAEARLSNAYTFGTGLGPGTQGTTPQGPLATVSNCGNPSAAAQELLDLINRARRNPTLEGQRLGIDLSAYPPMPPVAHDRYLGQAAQDHVADMIKRGFYGHLNPDGVNANGRILDTAYDLHSSYGNNRTLNLTENLGAGTGNVFNTPQSVHDTFMLDRGVNPAKHRNLILGAMYPGNRQVGIGLSFGVSSASGFEHHAVEEFARTNADRPFLIGSVMNDTTQDGITRAGEGVANVPVTLAHSSGFLLNTNSKDARRDPSPKPASRRSGTRACASRWRNETPSPSNANADTPTWTQS